jgi:hypothetical protein
MKGGNRSHSAVTDGVTFIRIMVVMGKLASISLYGSDALRKPISGRGGGFQGLLRTPQRQL